MQLIAVVYAVYNPNHVFSLFDYTPCTNLYKPKQTKTSPQKAGNSFTSPGCYSISSHTGVPCSLVRLRGRLPPKHGQDGTEHRHLVATAAVAPQYRSHLEGELAGQIGQNCMIVPFFFQWSPHRISTASKPHTPIDRPRPPCSQTNALRGPAGCFLKRTALYWCNENSVGGRRGGKSNSAFHFNASSVMWDIGRRASVA